MPRRSYRQYCALARALDVVGDRWSMLIVRNLLLGPQRWSDLCDGLPGIAKNLLTERLEKLQADGIIAREHDRYQLTPRGEQLQTALFALANWGEHHFMGPPKRGEAQRLRYFMTAIRRRLTPSRHKGWVQLVVNGEPYAVRLGPRPTVEQGERAAHATAYCKLEGLQALLLLRRPPGELSAAGMLAVSGDISWLEALQRALPAPTRSAAVKAHA